MISPPSCLLPLPALCTWTAPLASGQPSKRHCLLPPSGEKEASQPGLKKWDVFPHSPALRWTHKSRMAASTSCSPPSLLADFSQCVINTPSVRAWRLAYATHYSSRALHCCSKQFSVFSRHRRQSELRVVHRLLRRRKLYPLPLPHLRPGEHSFRPVWFQHYSEGLMEDCSKATVKIKMERLMCFGARSFIFVSCCSLGVSRTW